MTRCKSDDSHGTADRQDHPADVVPPEDRHFPVLEPDLEFVDPWAPGLLRCVGDLMGIGAPRKVLLREVCEYASMSSANECSVSIARLALRTGYSESWVRYNMRILEGSGLLSIVANRTGGAPGQTPVYRVNVALIKRLADAGRVELSRLLAARRQDKVAGNRLRRRLRAVTSG